MSSLLKGELFDNFMLREALLQTRCQIIIDGKRNQFYYGTDAVENELTYLAWKEIKPSLYHLLAGSRLPSSFKIVFSLHPEKAEALSDLASAFFLNINFKSGVLTCSTGVAYNTFTLDKTPEQLWDKKIEQFLIKYAFV
jgi:hypothetical protein